MFNGFVLFLGSVGLVLLWNLAMYINPNSYFIHLLTGRR